MSQVLEALGQLQCYEKKGCFLHRPLQYHTNMHTATPPTLSQQVSSDTRAAFQQVVHPVTATCFRSRTHSPSAVVDLGDTGGVTPIAGVASGSASLLHMLTAFSGSHVRCWYSVFLAFRMSSDAPCTHTGMPAQAVSGPLCHWLLPIALLSGHILMITHLSERT
jgi:hypothetical protein